MANKVVAIKIDVQGTADQKKKLEGLEKTLQGLTVQQRKLKKQLKDGAITRDQYAKSIAKVNLGLKGTRRQLLVTRQAMLGIDGFTTRLGKSFARLGTSISGAFIGLFAVQKLFSIIGDGIKTIEDFEQQMANVRAVTGATATEFKLLTDSAKDLGRASQFTATEVGNLQQEYAKLGFTTAEILAASEATLQLATATGTDLAQAAEVAASTVNGFGLTAQDTQAIVDLMAESFSSTPLDINKFQESMKLVAPTAKSVGQSVQDTTAQLGLLAKSGISGSIAGTQLNRVFIELNKKGISLKDAMAQVAESTNKLGTATELVGDRGAKALQIFADQSEELGRLETAFADSTGEAKKMADIVGNTAVGAAKRFDSAWEGLLLTIGDGTEKGIAKAKGALADLLNDFTDINVEIKKLNELDGGSLSRGLGIINEADERALEVLKEQEEFLKNNLQNRDNLQKALIANENQIKAIKKLSLEQLSAGNDVRDIVELEVKARQKSQLAIVEQLKSLKEKSIVEKATAEQAKLEAELAAKEGKKLSTAELEEIKKAKDRAKKEQDRKDKIDARDKERRLKTEQTFIDKVADLQKSSSLLAIEDEKKLQLEKLKIKKEALEAEAKLKVEKGSKLDNTLLSLNSSFKLKEDAINKSFDDKQKELDDKNLLKEKEDKLRKFENVASIGNFAINSTKSLIDSISNIELSAEQRKFERGIINEEEFAKAKYEIEKKAFNTQKKADIAQAIINGALAVSKAFAQGGLLGFATSGLVIAQTGAQVASINKQNFPQSFAEGGYTGGGSGTPDATGFRQAGVVHEGEYVVPKNVLESNGGSRLVGALESMRNNRPQPYLSAGFANGGFSSGGSGLDINGLRDEISSAVISSIGSIPVVNVATETTTQANRVNNIQSEATFG